MANVYVQTSFELPLDDEAAVLDVVQYASTIFDISLGEDVSKEDYKKVNGKLHENRCYSGSVSADGKKVWFVGEDGFDSDYFESVIKYAMKKYNITFASYTWSETCDKMRTDHFSGGGVVLMMDKRKRIKTKYTSGFSFTMEEHRKHKLRESKQ